MSRCSQIDLIYGVSGIGKTFQIGQLAEYIHETTGKTSRLVSCSGGGWGTIQHLVNSGIVVPTYIEGREQRLSTMKRMSAGWWPEDPDDIESPLIAPKDQEGYDSVGLVAFEGLSEVGDWLLSYLAQIQAEEESINFFGSGGEKAIVIKEGDEKFGSTAAGMYGMVQNYMKQFVARSRAIAGKHVVWTALELKARDEDGSRLPLFGPLIVGNALTSSCPAWFDNVLHLYFEGGHLKGKGARRMYLSQHLENNIPFLAKITASSADDLPDFLQDDKLSMKYFMTLLNESRKLKGGQ